MQVNSLSNLNQSSPQFKALKSIEYHKALKKRPDLQLKLKNVFEKNKYFNEFCKLYDVNLHLSSRKFYDGYAETSSWITYNKIGQNNDDNFLEKLKRFFTAEYIGLGTEVGSTVTRSCNSYIREVHEGKINFEIERKIWAYQNEMEETEILNKLNSDSN